MIIDLPNMTEEQRKLRNDKIAKMYGQVFGHDGAEQMTAHECFVLMSIQFDLLAQMVNAHNQQQLEQAFSAGLAQGIQRSAGFNGRGIIQP